VSQPPPSSKKLEFGVDRLPEEERTCPAWPSEGTLNGRQTRAYQRFLSPKPAPIGAAEHPEFDDDRRETKFRAWARGAKRTPEYRRALAEGRIRWNDQEASGDQSSGS
jgi:hypothetical protein